MCNAFCCTIIGHSFINGYDCAYERPHRLLKTILPWLHFYFITHTSIIAHRQSTAAAEAAAAPVTEQLSLVSQVDRRTSAQKKTKSAAAHTHAHIQWKWFVLCSNVQFDLVIWPTREIITSTCRSHFSFNFLSVFRGKVNKFRYIGFGPRSSTGQVKTVKAITIDFEPFKVFFFDAAQNGNFKILVKYHFDESINLCNSHKMVKYKM